MPSLWGTMIMETGFYHQSFFEYIQSEGINRSFLHDIIQYSPGHAKFNKEHQDITDALRLGDAFHAAILEPERFEKEYVTMLLDCKPGSGTGMKTRKEAFLFMAEEKGQTIIQPADYENIKEMAAVLQSNQDVLDLLSDGVKELSGYFIDEGNDISLKIRLDWINKKENIIIDLKSCADARKGPFRKSAYDHGYDLQAFMGLYGVTQITGQAHSIFKFIAIESKGYHGLKIYDADEEMIATGYDKYERAIALYKECLERNQWDGYDSTSEALGSPSWAKKPIDVCWER